MPLVPNRPEPRSKTRRRFFLGRVSASLASLIALTLIGIAIWGLWVSADVAHVVAGASVPSAKHNLSAATFLLVWIVFFGPFLYFGIAIVWSTFSSQSGTWLTPLRLFTYVVGLRAAAEENQRPSRNESGENALTAPRPPLARWAITGLRAKRRRSVSG